MEGIQVSVEKVGPNQNISVIKVGGYIDTTTSGELEHQLSALLKSDNYSIIIDLANVDYISSAGWGIFISEIKGIRQKNGDLKLVRMIPDVFEVFELLEFHYILKAFDSLEEAIADFDAGVSSSDAALRPPYQSEKASDDRESQMTSREVKTDVAVESGYKPSNEDPYLETIEEKLRQVIVEQPDAGMFQLIKSLNTPRFGNIKLGWFEMRKYLKQLNLESKKKRVAYFKQNTFG